MSPTLNTTKRKQSVHNWVRTQADTTVGSLLVMLVCIGECTGGIEPGALWTLDGLVRRISTSKVRRSLLNLKRRMPWNAVVGTMVAGLTHKVSVPNDAIDEVKTRIETPVEAHSNLRMWLLRGDMYDRVDLTDDSIAVFMTLGRTDLFLPRYPAGGSLTPLSRIPGGRGYEVLGGGKRVMPFQLPGQGLKTLVCRNCRPSARCNWQSQVS